MTDNAVAVNDAYINALLADASYVSNLNFQSQNAFKSIVNWPEELHLNMT